MPPQRRNSKEEAASASTAGLDEVAAPSSGPWPCCLPKGCLFSDGSGNEELTTLGLEDLADAAKVICTSDACPNKFRAPFMHAACFDAFEEAALAQAARNASHSGNPQPWADRHRLWSTKRGLEMAFPACECSCGNGSLRKDLEWTPPTPMEMQEGSDSTAGGARRKRKKSKSISSTKVMPLFNGQALQQQPPIPVSSTAPPPGFAPVVAAVTPGSGSNPQQVPRNRTNSISSSASSGSSLGSSELLSSSAASPASNDGVHPPRRLLLQDRSRHDSGGSIFQRRVDYSSFNVLPKHKINSYHIKMEDECSIGNDETRIFILSSYASNKMNRAPCVVCNHPMPIFDRYPLIDGTFFLSPRQHNKSCIRVKYEGKTHYLTAVCMGCLEGWNSIHCRFCLKPWNGAHLILGTMYSYDIFAAMPCCVERLKCNNCNQLVIHPEERFNFFSDYSQMVSCPNCGSQDSHFCKSLAVYVQREDAQKIAFMQRQHALVGMGLVPMAQVPATAAGMRAHRVNSA